MKTGENRNNLVDRKSEEFHEPTARLLPGRIGYCAVIEKKKKSDKRQEKLPFGCVERNDQSPLSIYNYTVVSICFNLHAFLGAHTVLGNRKSENMRQLCL